MRILVHDYAGHTFQTQLSRELARRGHLVVHAFRARSGGRGGAVARRAGDPESLTFVPVSLGPRASERRGVRRRLRHELFYGRALVRLAAEQRCEVVISANTPLLVQRRLAGWSARNGVRFVYWMEDWISLSQARKLRNRFGRLARPSAWVVRTLERSCLVRADAVVAATPGFLEALDAYRVPRERVTVIRNWAPLDELPVRERDNPWAAEHGLVGPLVFLYAGSLGLKHQPERLVELAQALPEALVVVVAQGSGADYVRSRAARLGLANVLVLPSQPYDRLPEVLASADVLVALLDHEGGRYSVPSKVLSYVCAARPVLASVPRANLTAQVVAESDSGIVVEPDAADEWLAAARRLATDETLRRQLGANGRAYAERTFDITRITDAFEAVISSAGAPRAA